jgi:simple sugar transport system substrate-binding protein
MKHIGRHIRGFARLAALVFLSGLAGGAMAADPLKVAFVYLGPVGDGGWTWQHDQGRQALEKAMGSKIKTTYVENVPETADAERVLRQLAADGNTLIFACSFGYMESVLKVAKQFPNVKFEHVNGFKTAANVVDYQPIFDQGFYLLGIIAGKMTKTNTLGFIGSFPIPDVVRDADAFELGALSVNPKAKLKTVWVSTWYDPGKERQAAETLIAQGADVLSQNTDSPAAIQAAQAKGVYAFALDSDMSKYGPKAHLTASTEDWSGYYIQETQLVLDGKWTGNRQTRWGLKEGMVKMAPMNAAIPADVVKLVEAKKAAIANGSFDYFAGPLKDNTGKLRVPAGSKLPFADMMSINWYVEGIEGTVPQ